MLQDNKEDAHILILSDEAQSSSLFEIKIPININKTLELNTITRCSKAIALGSLCYVNCDKTFYKMEHEFDGEKIQTYLFDGSGMTNDEKVQEYANQVVNTLDEIEEKYPYINFDLGVAIIVWDSDFKVNFFYS